MLAVAHVLGLMLAFFGAAYMLADRLLTVSWATASRCISSQPRLISTGTGVLLLAATRGATPRAQAARRLSAGHPGLGSDCPRSATIPLLHGPAWPGFHPRLFRNDVRPHDDGLDRVERTRRPAAVTQLLATLPAVGRRPRHHRAWRSPCCRCWASAACSSTRAQTPGAAEGREARAAHRRDGQVPVAGLHGDHRRRCRGAAGLRA